MLMNQRNVVQAKLKSAYFEYTTMILNHKTAMTDINEVLLKSYQF